MERVPIRHVDGEGTKQSGIGERIRELASEASITAKHGAAAKRERDQEHFSRKLVALERQIDQLVFELYELSPEDIAFVEQSSSESATTATRIQSGGLLR